MTRALSLLLAGVLLLAAPATAEATRAAHRARHHRHAHRRGAHHRRHRRHRRRRHRHHRRVPHRGPAQLSATCLNTDLTPTATNAPTVEAATLCLINRERATHGLQALTLDGRLIRAAEGHCADMTARGYFEHVSPTGSTPLQRVRASGFIPAGSGVEVAENIAWGSLWLASPREIVHSWMQSPGHRANILSRAYRYTGIGVAPHVPGSLAGQQAGAVYTQDFATLLP